MRTDKIKVTAQKVDELKAILQLPAAPIGDHLSNDEFLGYRLENLSTEAVRRVDEHLASCPDCTLKMEQLFESSETWEGETGEQRLAGLRMRLQTQPSLPSIPSLKERLAALVEGLVLWPNVSLGRLQAKTQVRQSGQTEDGTLRWRIVEDEDESLIIRFGSHASELEGMRLRLTAGKWQHEFVLVKVPLNQIGAEIVISQEERAKLPDDAVLRVELVAEK